MSWRRTGRTHVELQARYRDILGRLAKVSDEVVRQRSHHGPWLTVSRQIGSGGTELARRLAEPLGWQVYDREIVASISRQTHAPQRLMESHDEHAGGPFSDYLAHLIVPTDPGQAGYLTSMMRVVGSFAREGKAVILGRGSNFFLDPRFGLRLRVVAPFERRVAVLAEREGLEFDDARRRVEQHDQDQRAFIRQSFGRDINDPLGYDMTLNAADFCLETAAEVVATALDRVISSRARE